MSSKMSDEDNRSQTSYELRDLSVITPRADSPPPPYSTNSDSTHPDDGEMMEDSFSITGSSTASCSADVHSSLLGVEDDYDYPDVVHSEGMRIRSVTLEKDGRGFGFTVAGGSDSPFGVLPVFITSVDPDGVAAESGDVRLGDRIMSVNSADMEGRSHAAVVQAIKLAGRMVILELTEGPENIMNYLEFD